jgi:hypothetical protein
MDTEVSRVYIYFVCFPACALIIPSISSRKATEGQCCLVYLVGMYLVYLVGVLPRGSVRYKSLGQVYYGRVLDSHRSPKQFDGNVLHFTMPVTSGTRFAVLFFCQKKA